jgi:hypothetical protein
MTTDSKVDVFAELVQLTMMLSWCNEEIRFLDIRLHIVDFVASDDDMLRMEKEKHKASLAIVWVKYFEFQLAMSLLNCLCCCLQLDLSSMKNSGC